MCGFLPEKMGVVCVNVVNRVEVVSFWVVDEFDFHIPLAFHVIDDAIEVVVSTVKPDSKLYVAFNPFFACKTSVRGFVNPPFEIRTYYDFA
jgi:hypothetical protein